MAFSVAFQERLLRMEHDRNKRLSLLQAEKELQASKSRLLALKLAEIRAMEQRCSLLDQKIASQNLKISVLKSEIESLDSKHESDSQQLKVLMSEIENLEDLEKAKDEFYDSNCSEMMDLRRNVEKFDLECRMRVKKLKNSLNKLQSSFVRFQRNNEWSNSEIAAAEIMKSQLLAAKQDLDKNFSSNQRMRSHLQMELQSFTSIIDTQK